MVEGGEFLIAGAGDEAGRRAMVEVMPERREIAGADGLEGTDKAGGGIFTTMPGDGLAERTGQGCLGLDDWLLLPLPAKIFDAGMGEEAYPPAVLSPARFPFGGGGKAGRGPDEEARKRATAEQPVPCQTTAHGIAKEDKGTGGRAQAGKAIQSGHAERQQVGINHRGGVGLAMARPIRTDPAGLCAHGAAERIKVPAAAGKAVQGEDRGRGGIVSRMVADPQPEKTAVQARRDNRWIRQ